MLTTSTYKNEHGWGREVGCLSLLFFVRLLVALNARVGAEAFLGTAHGVRCPGCSSAYKDGRCEGTKLRQFLLLSFFLFLPRPVLSQWRVIATH